MWGRSNKVVGLDVSKGGKIQFPGTMTILTSTPGGGSGIWPVDKNCASGLSGLYMAGDCCATWHPVQRISERAGGTITLPSPVPEPA